MRYNKKVISYKLFVKLMQKQIFKILILLSIFFILPHFASADWQSTLSGAFPSAKAVETFDDLQDWNSGGFAANSHQLCGGSALSSALCPKNADGSMSIWQYYTNVTPTFSFSQSVGSPFVAGDTIIGSN